MVNVNNSFVANPPIDDGVLFNAPLGTELPTDALMALDEAFNDLGAVGENGIAINKTRTTQKVRRFGGKVCRTVQTEADHSVVITLLEDDNVDVLKVINGEANVVVHEPNDKGLKKTIYHSLNPLPIETWVIECMDGDKEKRYVIEKGQIPYSGGRRVGVVGERITPMASPNHRNRSRGEVPGPARRDGPDAPAHRPGRSSASSYSSDEKA